ncbi:MAG: hypothetical protein ACRDGA_00510 [Bacteroidota bacterium]
MVEEPSKQKGAIGFVLPRIENVLMPEFISDLGRYYGRFAPGIDTLECEETTVELLSLLCALVTPSRTVLFVSELLLDNR